MLPLTLTQQKEIEDFEDHPEKYESKTSAKMTRWKDKYECVIDIEGMQDLREGAPVANFTGREVLYGPWYPVNDVDAELPAMSVVLCGRFLDHDHAAEIVKRHGHNIRGIALGYVDFHGLYRLLRYYRLH